MILNRVNIMKLFKNEAFVTDNIVLLLPFQSGNDGGIQNQKRVSERGFEILFISFNMEFLGSAK
jgi:hypothetical protein